MVLWNELHPYSAIHVAQLRGKPDIARLRTGIRGTLEKCGLTRLSLSGAGSTFEYDTGPADCEIQILSGAENPQRVLASEMERQLNVPFDTARPFCPFRFLVVTADDSCFLGLVYFHPAADAESVVYLLKNIVTDYIGHDETGRPAHLELYPDSRNHLLWRHPMVLVHKLLALPAQFRNSRQTRRVHYDDTGNMTNGFSLLSLSPGELRCLLVAAKRWAVTINDLLMALLLKSVSPCAGGRDRARKRRKLSLGCIVNLRKDLKVESRGTFGLFLGSFTVTHEVPAGISLRKLAEDVQQQTAVIKRQKLYLATPLDLAIARFLLRFFSPERRRMFYPKNYPLWGGITNMNLNSLWEQTSGGALLDYFRGVSTGPATPLVLSVTTIGDRVNMGLSYRTTVFSKADVEGMQVRLREYLEETREAV